LSPLVRCPVSSTLSTGSCRKAASSSAYELQRPHSLLPTRVAYCPD
jgi:hypothetical protein